MMKSPLTQMTSSPTLKWLTRVGGGACAGGLTDFSQPITLKSGSESPECRPCPPPWRRGDLLCTSFHLYPFIFCRFFATLSTFSGLSPLSTLSLLFSLPQNNPCCITVPDRNICFIITLFCSSPFRLTFNNSVVHDGTNMQQPLSKSL